MYVLSDLTRAQTIARAYLDALERDPEAELAPWLEGTSAAIREIFEDIGAILVDGCSGAPTEHDVCSCLATPFAHVYAAPRKQVKLLITTGPAICDGVLHERLCASRKDAKDAAKAFQAVPHNYRS